MKTKQEIEKLAEEAYPNHVGLHGINIQRLAFKVGYYQCQEDQVNYFLSMIEEYREKELPNRNVPYHHEAEIASGLNGLINFIKNKQG